MSGRRDGWQARRYFSASLRDLLRPMHDWTEKAATQAEVRVFILDNLYWALPRPPFTEAETEEIAGRVYDFVWQRSASGRIWWRRDQAGGETIQGSVQFP